MTEIALYLLCITLSSMGGLLVMRFARNGRMVDIPGERSSHKEPVPTGGGIGILTAFLFASVLLRFPPGLWFPPAILALVSLYGDWFRLTPLFRLAIQFVAVIIFLFSLYPLMDAGPGPLLLPLLAAFFAVYIVGTANFFNFMDGIDGMLVTSGVIAFGFLAVFIVAESRGILFLKLSLSMAAACLGFLPLNFPRAKVFPGDVGSISHRVSLRRPGGDPFENPPRLRRPGRLRRPSLCRRADDPLHPMEGQGKPAARPPQAPVPDPGE
jgi:Fuc2NAc and GlcNAc transferase